MRMLISAYACEPHKGSEPEVGWRWVLDASKEYQQVVVVTRKNNQPSIEKEIQTLGITNVEFKYFDLPKWSRFWKKGGRGVQLYAYLWEIFSFLYLVKFYNRNEFEVSQRVTFVSYRFPSFLWYFSERFILGPIGGGERFPLHFLRVFSLKGKVVELLRAIAQRVALIDPLVLLTLYKSHQIIAVTEDTKSILPGFAQKKTVIKPAIYICINDFKIETTQFKSSKKTNTLKLLYVGRLIELKGLLLILMALKEVKDSFSYEFNIIGSGSDQDRLQSFIKQHALNVNFLGSKDRGMLSHYYLSHDLFVFPSLHDSGGMVVLEAKAHGLKVITSFFGGPKEFLGDMDIVLQSRTVEGMVQELKEIFYNESFNLTKQIQEGSKKSAICNE